MQYEFALIPLTLDPLRCFLYFLLFVGTAYYLRTALFFGLCVLQRKGRLIEEHKTTMEIIVEENDELRRL
jgi:hypothetical protein